MERSVERRSCPAPLPTLAPRPTRPTRPTLSPRSPRSPRERLSRHSWTSVVGGLPLSDGQRVSTLNGRGYTDWYLLGDSIGSLQLGVDGRGSGNIAALVAMQGVIPIDGGCVEADLPSAEGGTGARPGAGGAGGAAAAAAALMSGRWSRSGSATRQGEYQREWSSGTDPIPGSSTAACVASCARRRRRGHQTVTALKDSVDCSDTAS